MIKKLLPFLGIALFIYVLYRIGIENLYNSFKSANPYYLLIAIAITFIYTLLQTWKWDLILKRQNININFSELVIMQVKSIFYGVITPGRFGGFIKSYYLKEKINADFGKSISSVLIDRILDTLSVFILAFIGGLFLTNKLLDLSYVLSFGFIFVIAISYIIFNRRITKRLLGFFYNRFMPEKFKQNVKESFYSFYENLPKKTSLIIPFLANFLSWICTYTIAYAVALSLDIKISFFVLITMYSITTVISIIPITVSGLGTREASLIALLAFFIAGILPGLIGLIFILKNGNLHKTR